MSRPALANASNRKTGKGLGAVLAIGIGAAAVAFAFWIGSKPQETKAPDTVVAPAAPVSKAVTRLEDVTDKSGIRFTYRNGEEADRYTLLETLGGGVGMIDYDNDGRLDVLLPGGGGFDDPPSSLIHAFPTRLFRNLGDWKFAEVAGAFPEPEFYTHGCAVADYDRDGWADVLITGYGGLSLFHNEKDDRGGRRFVDVTAAAGLTGDDWSSSAAWGDLNGDGHSDLFVCSYVAWSLEKEPVCPRVDGRPGRDVCPPEQFEPAADRLYFNNGDGTFREAGAEMGLRNDGRGLGLVIVDVDENGQPDIYVANDASPNFLYVNQDGRLQERGRVAGVALDEDGSADGSMGVDAGDFDGDGRADLWVTNFQQENHGLYANLGSGLFQHESRAAGVAAIGREFVGFGTAFTDFDNDGWEDLVIVNGHVRRHPAGAVFRQRAVLLGNVDYRGRRFFSDVSSQAGEYFSQELLGRGLAVGDLDNDGRSDMVVSHSNSPVVVLRNSAPKEVENQWLGVELVGKGDRDVTGSIVRLELEGRVLTRFVKGGGSYLSSSDRRILFGLGGAKRAGRLTVRWAWGESERWEGLEPGAYYQLREGERAPVAVPPDRREA